MLAMPTFSLAFNMTAITNGPLKAGI